MKKLALTIIALIMLSGTALASQKQQVYKFHSRDRDCPAVGEKEVNRDFVVVVVKPTKHRRHHKVRRHR